MEACLNLKVEALLEAIDVLGVRLLLTQLLAKARNIAVDLLERLLGVLEVGERLIELALEKRSRSVLICIVRCEASFSSPRPHMKGMWGAMLISPWQFVCRFRRRAWRRQAGDSRFASTS